jgi:hypothetical protein
VKRQNAEQSTETVIRLLISFQVFISPNVQYDHLLAGVSTDSQQMTSKFDRGLNCIIKFFPIVLLLRGKARLLGELTVNGCEAAILSD